MADLNQENTGVYGGVEENSNPNNTVNTSNGIYGVYGDVETSSPEVETGTPNSGVEAGTIREESLPTKTTGFWAKFKAFWLQEIDWNKEIRVELTPYEQKIEDEINEFLHQEITWEKVKNFLFQEVKIF